MQFNSVTLVGRLTRDPEMRTTTTGKNFATFSIAVNKRFKPNDGGPEADFFNCKVWGQTADYVNQYVQKGRLVLVQGRIETRKYQDKDGNNREAIDIVCDQVTAMDSN
ncbi:single-stranded DNA-binding protein, partial [bacterium]